MLRRARIAVLVSGGGTNLQALFDAEDAGTLEHGRIEVVISNRADAYALERARRHNTDAIAFTRTACGGQDGLEEAILRTLEQYRIDLVVLAGYLNILSPRFIERWPDRILNIHPSLIPAFCGAGYYGLRVHEAALQRGVKLTGATVHYVNEIPDGGRILLQQAVEVLPDDTPRTLQQRVMQQAEWKRLPRAVEMVCANICEEQEEI